MPSRSPHYQVVGRDHEILVQLVQSDGADPASLRGRVEGRLLEELRSPGTAPPPLRVEMVDGIERDPEKMGKLTLVRSELLRA